MGVAWRYRAVPAGRARRFGPAADPGEALRREREIEALLAAFDHVVANGTLELVLVYRLCRHRQILRG